VCRCDGGRVDSGVEAAQVCRCDGRRADSGVEGAQVCRCDGRRGQSGVEGAQVCRCDGGPAQATRLSRWCDAATSTRNTAASHAVQQNSQPAVSPGSTGVKIVSAWQSEQNATTPLSIKVSDVVSMPETVSRGSDSSAKPRPETRRPEAARVASLDR
jgi:hypothetical protein